MPADQHNVAALAEALFHLGRATGELRRVEEELMSLLDLFGENEQVRRFLSDPHVTAVGKRDALEKLLGGRVHSVLLYFVLILQDADRIGSLQAVADRFFEHASRLRQKMTGEIESATPVPDEKVRVIEKEVSRILGMDVQLRVRIVNKVLAGLRLRVGDFVVDGTIDHELASIRRHLLSGSAS